MIVTNDSIVSSSNIRLLGEPQLKSGLSQVHSSYVGGDVNICSWLNIKREQTELGVGRAGNSNEAVQRISNER